MMKASCCPTTARATPGTLRPAAAAAATATALAFVKLRRLGSWCFHACSSWVISQRHRQLYALSIAVLTQLFCIGVSLLICFRHHDQLPRFQRRLTRLRPTRQRHETVLPIWWRCSDFWPARPGYRPAGLRMVVSSADG
ncbi:hypothetical protein KCP70_02365 [Salmonella enterica subsp. enterica]|nr:hypothetical protein KCP70_02365 [Salmonella enterica subsp. enterica]